MKRRELAGSYLFVLPALLLVVVLWITASDALGLGGPVLLGLVLLNVFRILPWKDMQNIHWEVVFLYAGATAIGAGIAATGAALYSADLFVSVLPAWLLAALIPWMRREKYGSSKRLWMRGYTNSSSLRIPTNSS